MPISVGWANSYAVGRAIAALTVALLTSSGESAAGPRAYDMTDVLVLPPPVRSAEGQSRARPPLTTRARDSDRPGAATAGGIVSEVRVGVMHHDAGIFGHHREGDVDANLEVLFVAPDFLRFAFSPRPHLGATYAPDDNTTSQVYFGLTWQYFFWRGGFVEGSAGGSYNDGSRTGSTTEKALGCHLLFRESVSLGYVFEGRHAVMATLDHISNATICDANDGLDTIGVRYGYRF